jgi:predicted kinase
MKVLLVVGLPASGKTYWAKRQVAQLLALGVTARLLDDPRTQEQLAEGLARPSHVLFITDPYLCQPDARKTACQILTAAGHQVEYVFFECDPGQCQVNARLRLGKPVAKFIAQLAESYQIPANAVVLPVYRASA